MQFGFPFPSTNLGTPPMTIITISSLAKSANNDLCSVQIMDIFRIGRRLRFDEQCRWTVRAAAMVLFPFTPLSTYFVFVLQKNAHVRHIRGGVAVEVSVTKGPKRRRPAKSSWFTSDPFRFLPIAAVLRVNTRPYKRLPETFTDSRPVSRTLTAA